ncbi:hypothetical protein [Nocardia australiensis]|uniref:hypothetical protein n=1 Tax=Nocardia australiensis TaxID=2887191 RepID=UPI001D136141|nr:hypothetical protein [Nocardia australiensis]
MSVGKIGYADGVNELAAATAGQHAGALEDRIVAGIAALGPSGRRQLEAKFALTVTATSARVVCTYSNRETRITVPAAVLALVREHRTVVSRTSAGPWWRLVVRLTLSGGASVDAARIEYDYGDEPFPGDQLFRPEVYRADIAAHPRARLPVWLAAYIGHGGRQSRRPRRAAAAVRDDLAHGIRPRHVDAEFPLFPQLWARWATLSAAYLAAGSDRGPRVVPSTGSFESARNGSSGSTLYVLPGGRAVLSGGVWNAPALNAAYNGGIDLPNLYAGAPDWVTNAVLNPRAAVGLLSFCFWWDGVRWYRGESPSVQECGAALPAVWTTDAVLETIAGLLPKHHGVEQRPAAARLLAAAERGVVTRELVAKALGAAVELDGALRQLIAADSTPPRPERVAGVLGARRAESSAKGPPGFRLIDGSYPHDHRIVL